MPGWRTGAGHRLLALVAAAGVLVLASDLRITQAHDTPGLIGGPFALLLGASTDLGPSHREDTQLTAELRDSKRPKELVGWAQGQGLSVRWQPGKNWAVVEGQADKVGSAFGVQVHDYRGQRGQLFYASPQQPSVPNALRPEVVEFGHNAVRPRGLIRSAKPGTRADGEGGEVRGVGATGRRRLAVGLKALFGVLADRLQESIAGHLVLRVGDDQGLVHEPPEQGGDLARPQRLSRDSGLRSVEAEATCKHRSAGQDKLLGLV